MFDFCGFVNRFCEYVCDSLGTLLVPLVLQCSSFPFLFICRETSRTDSTDTKNYCCKSYYKCTLRNCVLDLWHFHECVTFAIVIGTRPPFINQSVVINVIKVTRENSVGRPFSR